MKSIGEMSMEELGAFVCSALENEFDMTEVETWSLDENMNEKFEIFKQKVVLKHDEK